LQIIYIAWNQYFTKQSIQKNTIMRYF
jgi:hypothetical protein